MHCVLTGNALVYLETTRRLNADEEQEMYMLRKADAVLEGIVDNP